MARAKKTVEQPEQQAEATTPEMWVCACGATAEAAHKTYQQGWRLPKRVPTCPECVKRAKESQ